MGHAKKHQSYGLTPLFFILLVLPTLMLFPAPRSIDLRFRAFFGIEDGLSTSNVTCLFVDRSGFLWVGSQDGLNRFDGYSFRHYRHRPGDAGGLADNYIFFLHDDRLGRMWMRTRMGLEILDPHTGKVTHLGLAEIQGCSLEEARGGEMWYGTSTGKIFIFDNASGRSLPLPPWLPPDLFQMKEGKSLNPIHILEDDRGHIWIDSRSGLLRYTPASGRLLPFGLPGSFIPLTDERGILWIIHNTGLSRFDPAQRTLRHFPLPKLLGNNPLVTLDFLECIPDPSGLIWIGTNLGLAIFDGEKGEYIDPIRYWGEPRSVIPRNIHGLCKDPSGNIWMGVFGVGLCRFSPRPNRFQLIGGTPDTQLGFFGHPNCLLEDRTGTLWVGTLDAGLIRYDPSSGTVKHFREPLTIPRSNSQFATYVNSLLEDSSGSLWIGSANGLFRYGRESGKFIRFDLPPKLMLPPTILPPPNFADPRLINSIQEDGPDTLWICCRDEGIFRIDKKLQTSKFFKTDEIIPPGTFPRRLNRLFLDRSRTLWVCSGNGIHRLEHSGNRFAHFLPGVFTFSALEDRSGNFWIGTNQGLDLMDRRRGTCKTFSEEQGLAGDSLYHLAEDDDGCIWAGSNRGLARFDPHKETFQNFGSSDGIGPVPYISRRRDGQMLAGSGKYKGVIVFDPREVTAINTHVPPLFFTALRVSDRDVPLHEVFSQRDQSKETGRVTLQPGDRVLAVEFAALDFSAPEKNRYAFRMEEQGDAWNDLGTRRQLTFSNLSVGSHTLRVKGSNNDGVWNETGVALQIVVLPHFWQTWWFKVLALLILAGIVLAIVAVCRTISSLRKIAKPPNLDEIFNKYKISHREQEILHLVIQGKSNREMENELFISIPTVKRHLANIYEKIGVSSRLQLINFLQGRKPRY